MLVLIIYADVPFIYLYKRENVHLMCGRKRRRSIEGLIRFSCIAVVNSTIREKEEQAENVELNRVFSHLYIPISIYLFIVSVGRGW